MLPVLQPYSANTGMRVLELVATTAGLPLLVATPLPEHHSNILPTPLLIFISSKVSVVGKKY